MPNNLEIELSHYSLGSSATRRAATEAFGLAEQDLAHAYRYGQSLKLLVTLAQFGLFVVLRNAFGGTNAIKELKTQLIMHPRHTRVDCTEHRIAA